MRRIFTRSGYKPLLMMRARGGQGVVMRKNANQQNSKSISTGTHFTIKVKT